MEDRPRRKRRLDESILSKAKRYVKDDDDDGDKASSKNPQEDTDTPTKKRRKPRHASEEGKKFLKAKEKARRLEGGPQAQVPPKGPVEPDQVPAKKPSKKKKKKKKGTKNLKNEGTSSNHPETEERYRKEALAYLVLWKRHKDHWKFEKLKQVWLLKNALLPLAVDDLVFQTLLEYIGSVQGAAKEKTLREMESFMADFERKFGCQDSKSVFSAIRPEKEPEANERTEYDRARQIVRMLSDS